MTVIDMPRHDRAEETRTPESQDVTNLRAMLDDPALAGYHDDIRETLRTLTATSVLGA